MQYLSGLLQEVLIIVRFYCLQLADTGIRDRNFFASVRVSRHTRQPVTPDPMLAFLLLSYTIIAHNVCHAL